MSILNTAHFVKACYMAANGLDRPSLCLARKESGRQCLCMQARCRGRAEESGPAVCRAGGMPLHEKQFHTGVSRSNWWGSRQDGMCTQKVGSFNHPACVFGESKARASQIRDSRWLVPVWFPFTERGMVSWMCHVADDQDLRAVHGLPGTNSWVVSKWESAVVWFSWDTTRRLSALLCFRPRCFGHRVM